MGGDIIKYFKDKKQYKKKYTQDSVLLYKKFKA